MSPPPWMSSPASLSARYCGTPTPASLPAVVASAAMATQLRLALR